MQRNRSISEYIYNYSDNNEGHDDIFFKAKTRSLNQATAKPRSGYTSRVSSQNTQEVWQTQLPLCRKTRARELLPFCQYARPKPHYDLCLAQKQRQGQKIFRQLSERSKNHGRDQCYQSRSVSSKGSTVKGEKWTHPP
jgi:hypothetical protein